MSYGYAIYDLPLGRIEIAYEDNCITAIRGWCGQTEHREELPQAISLTDTVCRQLCEYCSGERRVFDFPYRLKGTEFQRKVWHTLCNIPYGETRSYKEIAEAVGNPKACRAVGMANHRNPMLIVVPCHRVIGINGSLTGYAEGLGMKGKLLAMEADFSGRKEEENRQYGHA